MSTFPQRIRAFAPTREESRARRWVYVPYDQLDATASLLSTARPEDTALAFVESGEKARRRPYHRQKLALLLSHGRHFALEMAARGFRVAWHGGDGTFGAGLEALRDRYGFGAIEVMEPAERELRHDLAAARERGLPLTVRPNALWLTTRDDFARAFPKGAPYRMEAFYREVRGRTGHLMEGGRPVGGRYSFDAENRRPWRGDPPAPRAPSFAPDEVTREVMDLVAERFPHAFGRLDGFDWPCAAEEVETFWQHALTRSLPHFGPFEDAMSEAEPDLFHTRVSPLVNLGRLTPQRVLRDALGAYGRGEVPLASAEGFVRQMLGWREFVKHVHDVTDGFRTLHPGGAPDHLGATEPLPPVYWGERPSGMRCLDSAVRLVRDRGWTHHITRLMVLSNLATLLGVSPRELTDWFWVSYVDAYDWVVEPNVLAMGTFGVGGVMTTKPYVSGAAYLRKMGDACDGCRFDATGRDATRQCPVTPLYWDFLHRNDATLAPVQRLAMPLASARRRTPAQHDHAARVRARVLAHLAAGDELPPDVAREP